MYTDFRKFCYESIQPLVKLKKLRIYFYVFTRNKDKFYNMYTIMALILAHLCFEARLNTRDFMAPYLHEICLKLHGFLETEIV